VPAIGECTIESQLKWLMQKEDKWKKVRSGHGKNKQGH